MTLGAKARNEGYEQHNRMPRVYPERSEKSSGALIPVHTPNIFSSGVCCNLNRIEPPLGLQELIAQLERAF